MKTYVLFAYLDPGTGSLIIQAILGAILAGTYFFRNSFIRVMRFVGRLFGTKGKVENKPMPPPK